MYLVNRSGNRPSHEGAAQRFDRAIERCRQAGFRRILLRGDTDFTQTRDLDRWDADGVHFIFGVDARPNLVKMAESLPKKVWKRLKRPAKYDVQTTPRRRPANVKEAIVRRRGFRNIRLAGEKVAEFHYRPAACEKSYRVVVVVQKNLSVEQGYWRLFDDVRYFFYITNDAALTASEVVFSANDRCDQENLLRDLKSGVSALDMPVDALVSNWAYMVMASLAWTLKAWFALLLPESGRWIDRRRAEKRRVLRMRFRTFATVRLRHRKTKGSGSRTACLAMVFKLMECASKTWRALNGSALLPDVIAGVQFVDGERKNAALKILIHKIWQYLAFPAQLTNVRFQHS